MSGPIGTAVIIEEDTFQEKWNEEKEIERQLEEELASLQSISEPSDEQLLRIKEISGTLSRRSAMYEALREIEKREMIQRCTSLVNNSLSEFNAIRESFASNYPDINLPEMPEISQAMPNRTHTFEEVENKLELIQEKINSYQDEIDNVIHKYRQTKVAKEGFNKTFEMAGKFSNRAITNTSYIIDALESDELFIGDEIKQKVLKDISKEAKLELEKLDMPEELEFSRETRQCLDELFNIENTSQAEVQLRALKKCLENEKHRKEQYIQEKKNQNQEQQRLKVAGVVANTLEDLGYTVSDIQDTAFVEEGVLHAISSNHENHLVRVKISDSGKSLQTWPMRITDDTEKSDTQDSLKEDKMFDYDLCENVHVKFQKSLLAKGIDLPHKNVLPTHGKPVVQKIHNQSLSERIRNKRNQFKERKSEQRKRDQLKTRTR